MRPLRQELRPGIVQRGYSYIFAARIKNMKKEITDMILDENGYQEIKDEHVPNVVEFR
ncbi:hypothetical protein V3F56_03145 [Moorellaceae bacterium AZ2]